GESCIEFGFGAGLEAKVITGPFAEILLDHGTVLVDLHRIDAKVIALVIELADRLFESGLKFTDLAEKQLREPKQDRGVDVSLSQVVNNFFDVRGQVVVLGSFYDQVTFAVHPKITGAPVFYAVGLDGLFNY